MSDYYGITTPTDDFLAHWGVKGMKWGVRKAVDKSYSGRPHSQAYNNAQKKLQRAAGIGGAIGGVAGGLAKGFAGGAIGGAAGALVGGTVSALKNRKALSQGPSKGSKQINKKPTKPVKPNKSAANDKVMRDVKRTMDKGALGGALTVGGGLGGSAVALMKYKKQHPKEYAAFQKRYKQMTPKERLKYSYGR